MIGDLVSVGWVFALVVVVVEVGVTEIPDLALQTTGYEDVIEGLQLALQMASRAAVVKTKIRIYSLPWTGAAAALDDRRLGKFTASVSSPNFLRVLHLELLLRENV